MVLGPTIATRVVKKSSDYNYGLDRLYLGVRVTKKKNDEAGLKLGGGGRS